MQEETGQQPNLPIRIALIGVGRMGQIRAAEFHFSVFFKLSFIIDTNLSAATKLATQYHTKAHDSLSTVLNSYFSEIDAIWISTPTSTHEDLIMEAAKAKKPIGCEKPIADQVENIRKCFEICEQYQVPLFCGFQRRFDPHYKQLYQQVQNGEIGQIQMIHAIFRDHPIPPIEFLKKGGDPFKDLAIHDIDFVRFLIKEEPCEVFAYGQSFHEELKKVSVLDTALLIMKFPSGIIATIEMSRTSSYGYDQRLEVFGSEGTLQLGNITESSVVKLTKTGIQQGVFLHSFPERFETAYRNEIQHFADIIHGKTKPLISQFDCEANMRVASAALESVEKKVPISI